MDKKLDFKEGELVVYSRTLGGNEICSVKRLTKTQIILHEYEVKFKRSDGSRVGATIWNTDCIQIATDDDIKKVALEQRAVFLYGAIRGAGDKTAYMKLSEIDKLEKIYDVYVDVGLINV